MIEERLGKQTERAVWLKQGVLKAPKTPAAKQKPRSEGFYAISGAQEGFA